MVNTTVAALTALTSPLSPTLAWYWMARALPGSMAGNASSVMAKSPDPWVDSR